MNQLNSVTKQMHLKPETQKSKTSFRVGLIGLGRWGKNYLRTLPGLPEVRLARVAGRLYQQQLQELPSGLMFTENWREVCEDSSLDAVIVATPPETHHEIVSFALDIGMPVLVEKPCTLSPCQCESIYNLAARRRVLCMVNFIHIFSRGYQDLKSSVSPKERIRYVFTENYAPGPYRSDVPVLLDWGCHDLAMCIDLLSEQPRSVVLKKSTQSKANPLGQIVTLELGFPSGISARCTFGNGSAFKRRSFAALCDDACFVYDGFSEGLAMNFSIDTKQNHVNDYSAQPQPLECAVREFIKNVQNGVTSHRSLLLAVQVHNALKAIKPD